MPPAFRSDSDPAEVLPGFSRHQSAFLEWITTAPGPRLGVIVHHTDAEREWAHDRESSIGRLARGLDEASKRGWVVVDMKQEWARIFQ